MEKNLKDKDRGLLARYWWVIAIIFVLFLAVGGNHLSIYGYGGSLEVYAISMVIILLFGIGVEFFQIKEIKSNKKSLKKIRFSNIFSVFVRWLINFIFLY